MGGLAKPTISVGTDIVPGPRSLPLQLRDAAFPFIVGGASGMVATTCIQPIDMLKVRFQLVDESIRTGPKPTPISVAREVVANGRILDLYSGLSAGLLRQVVYGTARLGFFFTFEDRLKARAKKDGRQVTFGERALASLSAGGLGAIIGNPTEVALIRMQSDGMKPEAQHANYRSVFDALLRTTREEGVRALWSGSSATVVRAMSTNFGQLAFFSQAKHQLR
jgi:solute carrier family 25 oxoglutarate transporter 11